MIQEPRFNGEVSDRSHVNMSRIKGKDTSIEKTLRNALWNRGLRYRKNYRELPGRPDIALTKYKIAIFCDSEFFHGKDWNVLKEKLAKGNNPEYWIAKIQRNIDRDNDKDKELAYRGWKVVHFWGREILKDPNACVDAIEEIIFEQKINLVDSQLIATEKETLYDEHILNQY